ncbi:protein-disulfide reductase DsbD domain-containing protein [Alloacidobacterium sp.]|uniref:protein-disulfide reductase DsbD domain-containing protein n=1 Tax=Alloacidobacterium sp. TaxID=2951999 RepID=UPI002D63F579|nr:protein-disulfide reductase DsbD domain-containing protein [Alloacidobacterium sp.]HYK35983.1 protein-disulfide reductase DsbD domain-containing protein [Alloacidobacterium sp.]
MRRVWSVFLAGVFCLGLSCAVAQKLAWQTESKPNDHQLVRFLYPEQVTLPAGKPSIVELHFRVNDGLHINSHTPREKSLIPTQLMVEEPTGVNVASIDFPAGADYSPAFSPSDKLSVYTGEFILRAHVTAQRGDHLVQAALRYQACDAHSCYPPKTAPVAVSVIAR